MNELSLMLANYLKGKSIYPSFRRALNILFNISIASFIYEKIYGEYYWIRYDDYEGILNFFVKGEFFIPFSILIVVYGFTQFTSILLFYGINQIKTIRVSRKILAYQYNKAQVEEKIRNVTKYSTLVNPKRLTKTHMTELYGKLRDEIKPEIFAELKKDLEEPKKIVQANFHLIFRAIIAITVYFIALKIFGCGLFIFVMIILLLSMYLLILSYRFLDIIPVLAEKLHEIAENYFNENTELTEKDDDGR